MFIKNTKSLWFFLSQIDFNFDLANGSQTDENKYSASSILRMHRTIYTQIDQGQVFLKFTLKKFFERSYIGVYINTQKISLFFFSFQTDITI